MARLLLHLWSAAAACSVVIVIVIVNVVVVVVGIRRGGGRRFPFFVHLTSISRPVFAFIFWLGGRGRR